MLMWPEIGRKEEVMSEFTKDEMIAMQNNLGLGHRGDIILTTQKRIDDNKEPIAKDIFNEAYAKELVRRWNSQPDLLKTLEKIYECGSIMKAEQLANAAISKATHKP